jgi:hypothetical protein
MNSELLERGLTSPDLRPKADIIIALPAHSDSSGRKGRALFGLTDFA